MNTHEVKPNENIYDIAQFYYGSKELGKQLAETNGYSSCLLQNKSPSLGFKNSCRNC